MINKVFYAPIRKKYHTDNKKKCVFCKFAKSKKILQGKYCYLTANEYPYVAGHLMVVLNRHIDFITGLKDAEGAEVMKFVHLASKALKEVYNAEGYSVGVNSGDVSGHSIKHLHMHVIPRYKNDVGFLQFVGRATITAEKPSETVKKLKKYFNKLNIK